MPRPRDDRSGQPVYVLDEPPEPGETALRPATPDDFDLLVPACAAAHEEEIGIDPMARDADGFRWRTKSQIEEGRSWVWLDGETILFKAEASAWTPRAVQVQQVWVDPPERNKGYAQRGMRDLCRLLLERVPTVCLFVRPENGPAIRVYEGIGMLRAGSYRSAVRACVAIRAARPTIVMRIAAATAITMTPRTDPTVQPAVAVTIADRLLLRSPR